jgi:hypothetical protein
VKLKLLSVALIVIAMICSSLRLLPAHWLLRKPPLRKRTWPAFAIGLLMMAMWFVHAATPYRLPRGCVGMNSSEFRILHVEKRGLHFHETQVIVARDARAWVLRNGRRLLISLL